MILSVALLSVGGSAVVVQDPACAQAESSTKKIPLRELAAATSAIRLRMERDHRIRIRECEYKEMKRAQVFLYLSEQPLPFVISLGWFAIRDASDMAPEQPEKGGFGSFLKKAPPKDTKDTSGQPEQIVIKDKGYVAVDELNLILPVPGGSPKEKGFDKAAWHAVLGFDALSGQNFDQAEKEFTEALKTAPMNSRINNNLGAILAAKGDYSKATSHIDRAIRENPNFGTAYTNRAFLQLAIGQPALALDDSLKGVNLEPDSVPAKIAYARALGATGKEKEALELAQTLRTEAPGDWQTLLLVADTYLANKQFKEARTALERLVVLNPSGDILLKLAHACDKNGDLDEAIKRARQATQAAPRNPLPHVTLARYLEANRDNNAAKLQYERAMDLKPDRNLRKIAMGALLRLLVTGKKFIDADDFSKRWLKQYPEDAECHFNRACIASQLGDGYVQESIDEYNKTLELQPQLSSAHYNLALLLIKTGKNTAALKELQAFVEKAPNDSDVESAKELIKKLQM